MIRMFFRIARTYILCMVYYVVDSVEINISIIKCVWLIELVMEFVLNFISLEEIRCYARTEIKR